MQQFLLRKLHLLNSCNYFNLLACFKICLKPFFKNRIFSKSRRILLEALKSMKVLQNILKSCGILQALANVWESLSRNNTFVVHLQIFFATSRTNNSINISGKATATFYTGSRALIISAISLKFRANSQAEYRDNKSSNMS